MVVSIPQWLKPLLRASSAAQRRRARAVLAGRSWDDMRPALFGAITADPSAAMPVLASLRAEAAAAGDASTAARLRLFEGYAIHRAGRLTEALAAYDAAAKGLLRVGLKDEATRASIARVDA